VGVAWGNGMTSQEREVRDLLAEPETTHHAASMRRKRLAELVPHLLFVVDLLREEVVSRRMTRPDSPASHWSAVRECVNRNDAANNVNP
jgi:hypothetical protein